MEAATLNTTNSTDGASVRLSLPRIILHLEGLAILLASVVLYGQISGDWLLFIVLLFVPDVAMAGYLLNTRTGAIVYNLVHTIIAPLVLLLIAGPVLSNTLLTALALIWLAHIGIDRAVGYGLKYPTAFKDTHLQRL